MLHPSAPPPSRGRRAREPDRGFPIDTVMERLEHAARAWRKAALFELYERGHVTPFEQLVACVISIRTLDEITTKAAERLFARARTPAALAALPESEIARLIAPSTFGGAKAPRLRAIAAIAAASGVPRDFEGLMALPGVGPKCASLVLGITGGEAHIGVDVHVHRITNRWGYVHETTPERTRIALERRLPHQYWVSINRLLVPFGKNVCTGRAPRCSVCPVRQWCARVGVTTHR
jgi:endonuclease-3